MSTETEASPEIVAAYNDYYRREGAKTCMDVLRLIEQMNEPRPAEETFEENWKLRRRVVAVVANAFGPTDARGEGFLAALAEYVHFVNTTGTPDLYVWRPDAAMTPEEIEADRARYLAMLTDEEEQS